MAAALPRAAVFPLGCVLDSAPRGRVWTEFLSSRLTTSAELLKQQLGDVAKQLLLYSHRSAEQPPR